ncbi:hypothetical protein Tco_1077396 [Tanacetum coccineum]
MQLVGCSRSDAIIVVEFEAKILGLESFVHVESMSFPPVDPNCRFYESGEDILKSHDLTKEYTNFLYKYEIEKARKLRWRHFYSFIPCMLLFLSSLLYQPLLLLSGFVRKRKSANLLDSFEAKPSANLYERNQPAQQMAHSKFDNILTKKMEQLGCSRPNAIALIEAKLPKPKSYKPIFPIESFDYFPKTRYRDFVVTGEMIQERHERNMEGLYDFF